MASYSSYYGGGFDPRLTDPWLGMKQYPMLQEQLAMQQGRQNAPYYSNANMMRRGTRDVGGGGYTALKETQLPEEQNVATVAEQIDANLDAMQGASEVNDLIQKTDFGFNAQQGEWPGTIFKDVGDFGSDVMTGGKNVGEFIGSQFTGNEPNYGLLSDDLMKGYTSVPNQLNVTGTSALPAGLQGTTGTQNFVSNARAFSTPGGSPAVASGRFRGISGSNAGGSIGQTIMPTDMNMSRQLFSPNYVDPATGLMDFEKGYNAATNSMQGTSRLAAANDASSLMASGAKGVENLAASGSELASLPMTDWNQLGTPAIQANIEAMGAGAEALQGTDKALQASKAAEAASKTGQAASGWGGKILPGIGAGLSIYDMVQGGVNPGNVMGLGSALAFMAPASMALGPLGWALAGGSLLGSLFDWW